MSIRPIQQAHQRYSGGRWVGRRNHITHGYFQVDYDTLWNVPAIEVPALIEPIKAIIASLAVDESSADDSAVEQ